METALAIVTLLLIAQTVRARHYRKLTCELHKQYLNAVCARRRAEEANYVLEMHNAMLTKALRVENEWPEEIQ